MANKFLIKYFPPSKAAKLRGDLTAFSQLLNPKASMKLGKGIKD